VRSIEGEGLVATRPGRRAVAASLDPGDLAAVAVVRGSRRAFPDVAALADAVGLGGGRPGTSAP